jgi:hypothetical protein
MSGKQYPFFDVPEDDISLLFTTRLQEDARVGCLRGVFDANGLSTSWLKGNEALESTAFGEEVRNLLDTLRHDGPLKNLQFLRQFCHEHPQARMSGRQTFYAFRIDTSRYRYYLRLFPQKGKFYLFCYQADHFREGRPEPDFNHLYRKKSRTKQRSEGDR